MIWCMWDKKVIRNCVSDGSRKTLKFFFANLLIQTNSLVSIVQCSVNNNTTYHIDITDKLITTNFWHSLKIVFQNHWSMRVSDVEIDCSTFVQLLMMACEVYVTLLRGCINLRSGVLRCGIRHIHNWKLDFLGFNSCIICVRSGHLHRSLVS